VSAMKGRIWLSGLFLLGIASASPTMVARAEQLPIYKLHSPKVDKDWAANLFKKTFGSTSRAEENQTALTYRAGNKILEIDKRSGHVFMGDMGQLWNPKVRPNLPDQAGAKDIADRFLKNNALLPNRDKNVNVVFSHHSETGGAEDTLGGVDKRL